MNFQSDVQSYSDLISGLVGSSLHSYIRLALRLNYPRPCPPRSSGHCGDTQTHHWGRCFHEHLWSSRPRTGEYPWVLSSIQLGRSVHRTITLPILELNILNLERLRNYCRLTREWCYLLFPWVAFLLSIYTCPLRGSPGAPQVPSPQGQSLFAMPGEAIATCHRNQWWSCCPVLERVCYVSSRHRKRITGSLVMPVSSCPHNVCHAGFYSNDSSWQQDLWLWWGVSWRGVFMAVVGDLKWQKY